MTIRVNGNTMYLADDRSVAHLVSTMGLPDRGIAVAVDGEVIPRSGWGRGLSDGAVVEIVTAVQGG
ncbi:MULTISPECIES: sulfur carrier protein ThiS [unclassified Gordonia (in: high G+C Gram-positive bacteria)]